MNYEPLPASGGMNKSPVLKTGRKLIILCPVIKRAYCLSRSDEIYNQHHYLSFGRHKEI